MKASPPAKKAAASPRAAAPAKKAAAPQGNAAPAKASASPKKATSGRDITGDPWEIVHAEFVAAAGPGSTLPDHGLEVAFAGRSNVGKSSLINTLTGRRNLVRTGSTPGVTRTLTQFAARTRAGQSFALVDLPGYGFAQRSKAERQQWAQLIERYLLRRDQLAVVVLLVDPRRGLEDDDRQLVEFVTSGDRPVAPEIFLAATKIDKLARSAAQAALRDVRKTLPTALDLPEGLPVIGWSSVTGEGKSELGRRISLALERAGARR